jgi:hypothetical protein
MKPLCRHLYIWHFREADWSWVWKWGNLGIFFLFKPDDVSVNRSSGTWIVIEAVRKTSLFRITSGFHTLKDPGGKANGCVTPSFSFSCIRWHKSQHYYILVRTFMFTNHSKRQDFIPLLGFYYLLRMILDLYKHCIILYFFPEKSYFLRHIVLWAWLWVADYKTVPGQSSEHDGIPSMAGQSGRIKAISMGSSS